MYFLYNIFVIVINWFLKPIALINKKINLFVKGRSQTFTKLNVIKKTDRVIWFHCASLGEFEQGRPIIENLSNNLKPNYKIVLTFFSPSGYEIQKNYDKVDVVCYLPIDTKKNARRFLDKIHPEMVIFVKYEFWPNILKELKNRHINTILVSGIFRENQVFFKSYGSFMRKSLQTFDHFFVQDEKSEKLLQKIRFNNATISGDTRFDRVFDITKQDNKLNFIEDFIQNKHTLVAGSTWKKDEELLVNYINNYATNDEKFIIAPHNITNIEWLKNAINKDVTLYSDKEKNIDASVFIVDTIGILTKIYSYANVAYIGGGFGTGIHNILEPATFGVPIIIGPNYQKFKEAVDLVDKKGCFVIKNKAELIKVIQLFKNDELLKKYGTISENYVKNNIGATLCIISYINKKMTILQ
jgi:3-deoxy-D-manno-octulosonic-acid transferase